MQTIYAKANIINANWQNWEDYIRFLQPFEPFFYNKNEQQLRVENFKEWYFSNSKNDTLILFYIADYEVYTNVSDRSEICIFIYIEAAEIQIFLHEITPFLDQLSKEIKCEINFNLLSTFSFQ